MDDKTWSSNPHSLQLLLTEEITVTQAQELAEYLEHDPTMRSAVEEMLSRDTLVGGINATISHEMRQLPVSLAEVIRKLKQHERVASLPPSSTQAVEKHATSRTVTFLSPPQEPDELGRLNGYRILRILGEGGMGMVFAAEDIKLKRRVALKVMKPEISAKAEYCQRFLREAQAAAKVEHDHIVPIFQIGEDNGVPFIAMPFLRGESLTDRLKKGKLSLAEIVRIGLEITHGLSAAHKAGLIHRDVKPANIWLEEERDRVKILDFGLARLTGTEAQLTQSGAIVGTPAYMAPEQARGKKIDHRADLFSLGCVLYEMTTGHRPFSGSDTLAILSSLALDAPADPRALNSQIPQRLANLIMKLLAKNPDDRPASAQVVTDELTALHSVPNSEPGSIRGESHTQVTAPAPSLRSFWFRLPGLVTAAVLLLVLGNLLFGTTLVRIFMNQAELVVEVSDPEVEVRVRQNNVVIERKNDNTWVVSAGRSVVELTDRKTGVLLIAHEFLLGRNEKELVRVSPQELDEARIAKGLRPVAGDSPDNALHDPGILLAFQKQLGKKLTFRVTGSNAGFVWGTNVYSIDSSLATAAVHVGLLKVGETGVVEVEFIAAPECFTGSLRNGITTLPYPGNVGAFRFPHANPSPVVEHAPQISLAFLPAQIGKKHSFTVRGARSTYVWGTDVYTQDSDLGTAAVHAGIIKEGERGLVMIVFVDVPPNFFGSLRNGVDTLSFGKWEGGAYRIVQALHGPIDAYDPASILPTSPFINQPLSLVVYSSQIGRKLTVRVTGEIISNSVWGTDLYSLDSSLATAAVHAGMVQPGETKLLEVELLPSPQQLIGSTRNGVKSMDYGLYSLGVFRFVKPMMK